MVDAADEERVVVGECRVREQTGIGLEGKARDGREGAGVQGVKLAVHGRDVDDVANNDGRRPDTAVGLETASLTAGSGVDSV